MPFSLWEAVTAPTVLFLITFHVGFRMRAAKCFGNNLHILRHMDEHEQEGEQAFLHNTQRAGPVGLEPIPSRDIWQLLPAQILVGHRSRMHPPKRALHRAGAKPGPSFSIRAWTLLVPRLQRSQRAAQHRMGLDCKYNCRELELNKMK